MRPAAKPIGFLLLACSAVAFDPCVDPDPKLIAGTFPKGFAWATATAAFQIEGGWNASDKGPSTWDVFNHQAPSPVVGDATGDVACDSYHRWRSDIALLRGMKLRHYRLSLSWPRLLPNGLLSGGVSKAGVKYYRDLLRGLKAAGIAPLVTLFHWDLPMHLHELGGFRSPAFPGWFRDYAELCFALFGRYVKTWITFNEPTIIVGDPAGDPLRRPFPEPGTCEYLEAHQLLLAHGEAARLFRARFRPYHGGRIGMALSCGGQLPKTLAAKDSEASDRAYHFDYGWFAGPMLQGDYPAVMRRVVGQRSRAEGRAWGQRGVRYKDGALLRRSSSRLPSRPRSSASPAPSPSPPPRPSSLGAPHGYSLSRPAPIDPPPASHSQRPAMAIASSRPISSALPKQPPPLLRRPPRALPLWPRLAVRLAQRPAELLPRLTGRPPPLRLVDLPAADRKPLLSAALLTAWAAELREAEATLRPMRSELLRVPTRYGPAPLRPSPPQSLVCLQRPPGDRAKIARGLDYLRASPSPVGSSQACLPPSPASEEPPRAASSTTGDTSDASFVTAPEEPPARPEPPPGAPPAPSLRHIRLASVNLNGWRSKRDLASATLAALRVDVMAIQESKLGPRVLDEEISVDGFALFRTDRDECGGGLALLVRRELSCVELSLPPLETSTELQGVRLGPASRPLYLLNTYRRPGQSAEERDAFVEDVATALGALADAPLIFVGDANLDAREPSEAALHEALTEAGLSSANPGLPTHRARQIDILYSRDLDTWDFALEAPLERGDGHSLIRLDLSLPSPQPRERRGGRPQWQKADIPLARSLTILGPRNDQRPFHQRLPSGAGPDALLDAFYQEQSLVIGATVPTSRSFYVKAGSPAWVSRSVCELSRETRRLWQASRDGEPGAWRRYKKSRNRLVAAVRDAKRHFAECTLDAAFEKGRPWEAVRRLKGAPATSIPAFEGPSPASSDAAKAEALAASFATNFAPWEPPPPRPLCQTPRHHLLSEDGTLRLLKAFPSGKAPGLSGVPCDWFKSLRLELAPAICCIVNACLVSQSVPEDWRTAVVVPVPKQPSPKEPSHFRPISLLPASSRVLEAHMLELLEPFLRTSRGQYGFKARSGCSDAMAKLLLEAGRASAGTVDVAVVLLDAVKAFDRLRHTAILDALRERGAPANLLNLCLAWLSRRSFRVRVGESLAEPRPAPSGVPQGSRLGPSLFTAAVDGVFRLPLPAGVRLVGYADDLALVGPLGTPAGIGDIQTALLRVETHLRGLGLELSPTKSQWLRVCLHKHPGPAFPSPALLNGRRLPQVDSARYLGLLLDRRLSLSLHWQAEARRLKCLGGALRRLVSGHSKAFSLLAKSCLEGRLRHTLAAAPPTLEKDWDRLRASLVYVGRLHLRDFARKPDSPAYATSGAVVLQRAALPEPRALALECGLSFLYASLFGGRAFGGELQLSWEPQRRTRAQRRRGETQLLVPRPTVDTFARLGPYALQAAWNSLCLDFPPATEEPRDPHPLASRSSFKAALPGLIATLLQ